MSMLEVIASMTPEQILAVFDEVKDALDDQREFTRQANLAYDEVLALWHASRDEKFSYKDALEEIYDCEGSYSDIRAIAGDALNG